MTYSTSPCSSGRVNPVVTKTPLRAYPGWVVRRYRDGMFDASDDNGVAVSPGYETFGEAVEFAKSGGNEG